MNTARPAQGDPRGREAAVSHPGRTPRHTQDRTLRHEGAVFGMWIFIASELLFFGGLLVAYAIARNHWPHGFEAAGRHTDALLGSLNTALLLTSSATMAAAVMLTEHHRPYAAARLLWLTAALGVGFLAVKGIEYHQEWTEGLFPRTGFRLRPGEPEPGGAALFFVIYWVMTGLHAVHLAVGVAMAAAFAEGVRRERPWAGAPRVQVAGLYWHFVDGVWILWYPLLYLVGRAT
jgi:cytochrome c oxidase subunit 3